MCGTYRGPEVTFTIQELKDMLSDAVHINDDESTFSFGVAQNNGFVRRTDTVSIITANGIVPMRWGFSMKGTKEVNPHARTDSILDPKSTIYPNIQGNRGLVIAEEYREKQFLFKPAVDGGGEATPPFFMACLFRPSQTVNGAIDFAVVTRDAAPHIAHIHGRMPLILGADVANIWLNPKTPLQDVFDNAILNVSYRAIPSNKPPKSEQISMF